MSIFGFFAPIDRTANLATQFTLTLSASSGANGVPVTVTVTPNGVIASTVNLLLFVSGGGTLGLSGFTFPAGSSAAQSTTLTRSTNGTSTITMSNDGGLGNAGTPASYDTPQGLPTWRLGQAVNEWRQIAGTAMQTLLPTNVVWNMAQADHKDQNTGLNLGPVSAHTVQKSTGANIHNSRLDAYCGATIDTRTSTLYTAANGGHGDYWGNEVCALNLMANTPAWTMVHAGSNGDVVVAFEPMAGWNSFDQRRYATDLNGQALPCSRHTYGQLQFIERHNRVVTTGGAISPNGGGFQDIEAYDVSVTGGANGWDPLGTYPGAQGGVGGFTGLGGGAVIGATCVKDPSTEVIYTFSSDRLHMVSPSSGGPTGAAGSGGTYSFASLTWNAAYPWSNGASAVDTTRGKILWTHGYGLNAATNPYTFDIAGGALDAVHTYSGGSASALAAVPPSCGVIYVPALDRYLLRDGSAGGSLFVIDPATFDVSTLTTTGGSSLPAQFGSGNSGPGVFNKWQLVPALGGAVYLPGAQYNAWFIRLW